MKLSAMTTLTGKSLLEAFKALDDELKPFDKAYKPISGGAGAAAKLTDIVPGYLIEVLLDNFGPLGLGWGYDLLELSTFDEMRTIRPANAAPYQKRFWVSKCRINFWYAYQESEQTRRSELIPGMGGSDNERGEWAEKGALTNAIGMVMAHMGYQVSVYKGLRSHRGGNAPPPPSGGQQPSTGTGGGQRRQSNQQQQPKGLTNYPCRHCGAPVYDNRTEQQQDSKKSAWRCSNKKCGGGKDGRPWASWKPSEYETEESGQAAAKQPHQGQQQPSQQPPPDTVKPEDRQKQADALELAKEKGISPAQLDRFCRRNLLRRPFDQHAGGALVALLQKLGNGEVLAWLEANKEG